MKGLLEREWEDYSKESKDYLESVKRAHPRRLSFFRGAEAVLRVVEEHPQDLEKVRLEIDRVLNEWANEAS